MNQQITFLSDGGDTVRELQLYLNPQAEHLLDWFHVSMRLTVMNQMAKGLGPEESESRESALKQLESIKWRLWPLRASTCTVRKFFFIIDTQPHTRKLYGGAMRAKMSLSSSPHMKTHE